MSLSAVMRNPGSGTAELKREEKPASLGREGRDEEDEESGIVGEETSHQRREDDKKETGRRTTSTKAPGGRARNPATLHNQRGTIRCVSLRN
ncbi:hypothetical protein NDU88_006357 [Pleurodeles waltl]|uniref:Uncharacterized protein n=1 Tax=Pleurodeles waltl TaxID=8319 RepID=A0AAV7VPG6_PLEWA|nr:hypothetical protein NDU88_006357 [Pleurodeles waltl]